MKVLLVDDDATLADVTQFALRRAGFLVITAATGSEALRYWEQEQPDLIILDLQLPDRDGWSVCRAIREVSQVPIIMLTARSSDDEVVQGLELGADDYVTKPFSPKQLIARAHAVLRRGGGGTIAPRIAHGSLILDPNRHQLQTPAGMLKLTRLEFRLLHYLMVNRGQVVPTETILNHVWGSSDTSDRMMLKQLIYRLRQKLASLADGEPLIQTVAGIGYLIEAQPIPAVGQPT
jgi:DNA-binding response OmpR family regulator